MRKFLDIKTISKLVETCPGPRHYEHLSKINMDIKNRYYLGEFSTDATCISIYPKNVPLNDGMAVDGNVSSLAKAFSGDTVLYDAASVNGAYDKYYGYSHSSLGKDRLDAECVTSDINLNEYKQEYQSNYPANNCGNYTSYQDEYAEAGKDLHGCLDYAYLQQRTCYIGPGNLDTHFDYMNPVLPVKRGESDVNESKLQGKGMKRGMNYIYNKNLTTTAQKFKAKREKSHTMVTRMSIRRQVKSMDNIDLQTRLLDSMDLADPQPSTPSVVDEGVSLGHESRQEMANAVLEITPKIELQQEYDVTPLQGIAYYINSYTIHVFGMKKYRPNCKNLTCVIFSVPKEAITRRKITIKYLLNYHQSLLPTILLLESLKTYETFLTFCKDADLARTPHKIFSKIILKLGKSSSSDADNGDATQGTGRKFKRSWKPDSITTLNATKSLTQPRSKPLGKWAGFFCGDYKARSAAHSSYVEGLYLVDIDDIAVELEGFEHQFKWEIDLLWERGEIARDERDEWYRLGGLDHECMAYHKMVQERYEKNMEFYGHPYTQLDAPDNHVIEKFNVINPPPNFTPLPPFIEPKLKYPRPESHRGIITSYVKEQDQDFSFKLSLHFPHEFINPQL